MKNQTLLRIGGTGTAVTAICCFTPVLVLLFSGLGLSAWLAWSDYVLLPLLAIFLTVMILAVVQRGKASGQQNRQSTK